MIRTYDEILNSMKSAYYNECGYPVDDYSETLRRFEIVASELYAVSCYGDYILKQSFVQTATGESLDKLGELRGCYRKHASKAEGILTFSIDEPMSNSISIPEGTICSAQGKPFIQFATVADAAIQAGELSVDVPAIALTDGYKHNVSANEITVMVNAPVGVARVTNNTAFAGGFDDETDEVYRGRIIRHYNILPNGVNATSFENLVLTLDYVTDCYIPNVTGFIGEIQVFVATKNGELTEEQIREIKAKIPIAELVGMIVTPIVAQNLDYSLLVSARVMRGFDEDEIREKISNKVRSALAGSRIGRAVSLSSVSKELTEIEGLKDFSFYSDMLVGNELYCPSGSILHLTDLAVSCTYE